MAVSSAEGEAHQLMSEADAERRQARAGQLADGGERVSDRGRIARPVGKEEPIGLQLAHLRRGVVSAGTTVTLQPACTSMRTMLRFIP